MSSCTLIHSNKVSLCILEVLNAPINYLPACPFLSPTEVDAKSDRRRCTRGGSFFPSTLAGSVADTGATIMDARATTPIALRACSSWGSTLAGYVSDARATLRDAGATVGELLLSQEPHRVLALAKSIAIVRAIAALGRVPAVLVGTTLAKAATAPINYGQLWSVNQ